MKRVALITVVIGAALALVPAVFAAEVSDGGGASGIPQTKAVVMAPTSYADAVKTYGSISTPSTTTTTPMSQIDPAIRAVLLRNGDVRGDASFSGQTDTLGGTGTTQATSDSSFSVDWNALIPALLVGTLLLGTAFAVATRRRHQHQLSV